MSAAVGRRERILLIRTSALGDVVHCLPVLTALRRHRPDAHLGWVIESSLAPLLARHPDLDQLLVVRTRGWRHGLGNRTTWQEMLGAVLSLREFRADLVLDLMGNHKAGVLAALSGCRRRLGFSRQDRREPSSSLWINEYAAPAGSHAVDRALSLLTALGLPVEPADFGGEKLFQALPPAAEQIFGHEPEPFALLSPGAGWHNKRLPAATWAEVARRLRETTGLATWVTGGPGEGPLLAAIVEGGQGAVRDLGTTDLPTFSAFARRARLVLGGDSGPIHLAHALGAPVLAVMGPTDPLRHGPYGAPARALVRPLPCSFCYRRFSEPKACLTTILASEVADRARILLLESEDPGAN